jgi:hypothetical protein
MTKQESGDCQNLRFHFFLVIRISQFKLKSTNNFIIIEKLEPSHSTLTGVIRHYI